MAGEIKGIGGAGSVPPVERTSGSAGSKRKRPGEPVDSEGSQQQPEKKRLQELKQKLVELEEASQRDPENLGIRQNIADTISAISYEKNQDLEIE